MKYEFMSAFADQITEMLEFKEALGYARSSYDKFLINFDSVDTRNKYEETILELSDCTI